MYIYIYIYIIILIFNVMHCIVFKEVAVCIYIYIYFIVICKSSNIYLHSLTQKETFNILNIFLLNYADLKQSF